MFTGLVAEVGRIRAVEVGGRRVRVDVSADFADELSGGDSVAVAGVCLTASDVEPGGFSADLSLQTLERTTLSQLMPGDRVNIEAPVRPSDRLGGHIVQGHVDATATVSDIAESDGGRVVRFTVPEPSARYLVEKGSVAIDGVSLTVADRPDVEFAVALVPETLKRTTLGDLRIGERVNIETDIVAKYVERLAGGTCKCRCESTQASP